MVDGKGGLVKAILTAGQVSDMKIAPELVNGASGVRIVGDKGYYRHRHHVENFFQRIKRLILCLPIPM